MIEIDKMLQSRNSACNILVDGEVFNSGGVLINEFYLF